MNSIREYSVCAVLGLVLVSSIWFFFGNEWPVDMSAIYFAARSYGLGMYDVIYLSPEGFFGLIASEQWKAMVADLGFAGEIVTPYVYPPLWAAVLSPFATHMDPMLFFNVTLAIQAFLLAYSIIIAYRIVNPAGMSLGTWYSISFVIVLFSYPFYLANFLNQPQITLAFLILVALKRYRNGASITAGVILGVAAAIKITPALLGLIFIMDRDWKAALSAAGTGAVLLATSIAVAGIDLHMAFIDQLGRASSNLMIAHINHSLEALAYQWSDIIGRRFISPEEIEPHIVVDPTEWIRWTSRLTMVGAIFLVWVLSKNMSAKDALFGRLLGMICATTFLLPLAWSHYLITPMLLMPGIFAVLSRAKATLVILAICAPMSIPFRAYFPMYDYDAVWPMSEGAIALIILYVLALMSFYRKTA